MRRSYINGVNEVCAFLLCLKRLAIISESTDNGISYSNAVTFVYRSGMTTNL